MVLMSFSNNTEAVIGCRTCRPRLGALNQTDHAQDVYGQVGFPFLFHLLGKVVVHPAPELDWPSA